MQDSVIIIENATFFSLPSDDEGRYDEMIDQKFEQKFAQCLLKSWPKIVKVVLSINMENCQIIWAIWADK